MKLIKAKSEEAQTALALLKETAEWLQEIGSDQWSDVLEGKDKHGLVKAVEKGEVFFFYNNAKQLVGMAAAWETPTAWDELLWKEYGTTQKSRYIHRVIIRPLYRKEGYGKELLDALKKEFETQTNELRLDCLASNHKLVAFYKSNGFTHIGHSQDSTGLKFELFSYIF
ncbi:GNAT family N-acetyltransferase [Enterococcus termitis]|uniref:GNAT family N-acetyltransferase n=1 Tax=Enterococcus termitis TaxID=332950 RepID=A0A1E5GAI5_9ENTE|nr:GNAT family N-acetyltransferase [Enterococcus termitis]OEG09270.1 GNAT family N-acetyltransferase [Enterococcus termitis]OJG95207.1 hypothetical protein RV18_GL002923 [Enterococcus termitis]